MLSPHSSDYLLMRLRALSTLHHFLTLLAASLAFACLAAAYSFHSLNGPNLLLRYWPDYYRELAAADPQQEESSLAQLLLLSPRDSDARLRLALIVEWRGDLARASALFTQAATDDARYRAQWPRLEFEARHPHLSSHGPWPAARRCFAMSFGDRRALLDTVWRLRPDAPFLLTQVIPDSAPVLFYTTAFLMEQGDLASARVAFSRLIALPFISESRANAGIVATATERAHLGLDLTDLHLDRHDPGSAIAIWQSLAHRQLLRVDGSGAAGRQVMNPNFRTAPLGRGFDWRLPAPHQTDPNHPDMRQSPEGWRVDLASHPPDLVPLLSQRVLLPPGPLPQPQIQSSAPGWVRARLLDEASGQELTAPTTRTRVAKLSLEYFRPHGSPPLRQPLVVYQVRWSQT